MEREIQKPLALILILVTMISVISMSLGVENVRASEIEQDCDMEDGGTNEIQTTTSSQSIRTPAEWETTEEVLVGADGGGTHTGFINRLKSRLEKTNVTVKDVNDYPNTTDLEKPWVRDYGPISIMNSSERQINDMGNHAWGKDYNEFPQTYGAAVGETVHTLWEEIDNGYPRSNIGLWFSGGDFMVDSGGIFYHGSNWDDSYNDNFGIYESNQVDSIHVHIDMYAKLVSENTVIIAEAIDGNQVPNGGTNLSDTDGDILEDVVNYFESSSPRNGEDYQIFRVPAWKQDGSLVSYTNSLIVNDYVIIPEYNYDWKEGYDWDEHVAGPGGIYANAMPGYSRETVISSDIIQWGGAVHCATMQIPKENAAPVISDVDGDIEEVNSEFHVTVSVDITDDGDIEYADLYYRVDGEGDFTDVALDRQGTSDTYNVTIELDSLPGSSEFEYFIRVEDDYRAVSYFGDVWEPKTFEPHVNIYEPGQGHTVWPTVDIYWESNTPPGAIDHYSIRCRFGSEPWDDWINKDMYTNHTYTDMSEGEWSVQVRITTYDSETYTDEVTFTVSKPQPHVEITQPDDGETIYNDTVHVKWTSDTPSDAIDYFAVRLDDGVWINVGTDTEYTFTNLEYGIEYTVTVKIETTYNDNTQDSVTFYSDKPHVEITQPDDGETIYLDAVHVKWMSYTNSDAIDYFAVQLDAGKWINVGMETEYTFTDLEYGLEYTVTVKIETIYNDNTQDSVTFYTEEPPHLPMSIESVETEDDTATVQWINHGSIEVDYYEIRLNGGEWVKVDTSTSHTFQNLEERRYTVTVRMWDTDGDTWRDTAVFSVGDNPP